MANVQRFGDGGLSTSVLTATDGLFQGCATSPPQRVRNKRKAGSSSYGRSGSPPGTGIYDRRDAVAIDQREKSVPLDGSRANSPIAALLAADAAQQRISNSTSRSWRTSYAQGNRHVAWTRRYSRIRTAPYSGSSL